MYNIDPLEFIFAGGALLACLSYGLGHLFARLLNSDDEYHSACSQSISNGLVVRSSYLIWEENTDPHFDMYDAAGWHIFRVTCHVQQDGKDYALRIRQMDADHKGHGFGAFFHCRSPLLPSRSRVKLACVEPACNGLRVHAIAPADVIDYSAYLASLKSQRDAIHSLALPQPDATSQKAVARSLLERSLLRLMQAECLAWDIVEGLPVDKSLTDAKRESAAMLSSLIHRALLSQSGDYGADSQANRLFQQAHQKHLRNYPGEWMIDREPDQQPSAKRYRNRQKSP